MVRLELVIDELVLTGFDARERHRIADALEQHLAAGLTAMTIADAQAAAVRAEGSGRLIAPDALVLAGAGGATAQAIASSLSQSVIHAIAGRAPATSKREAGASATPSQAREERR